MITDPLLLASIAAGVCFFGWPLRMNQSGLSAVSSTFVYAVVAFAVAVIRHVDGAGRVDRVAGQGSANRCGGRRAQRDRDPGVHLPSGARDDDRGPSRHPDRDHDADGPDGCLGREPGWQRPTESPRRLGDRIGHGDPLARA
jgi:hypothetical protein